MTRHLIFGLCLFLLIAHDAESKIQSTYPVITPENVSQLAVITLIRGPNLEPKQRINNYMQFHFHPDSQRIAVEIDHNIGIVDTMTGEVLSLIQREERHSRNRALRMTFSLDGTLLATAGDNAFTIWSVADFKELFSGSAGDNNVRPPAMTFTPNNRFFLTADDKVIRIWDVELQQEVDRRQFCGSYFVRGQAILCFTDSNGTAAHAITLFNLETFGTIGNTITFEHGGVFGSETLTTKGQLLTLINQEFAPNKFVYYILDLENQAISERVELNYRFGGYFTNHNGRIIGFSGEDGLTLVDPLTNGVLMIFDRQTWYWISLYARFSPDGTLFAVSNMERDSIDVFAVSECYITANREVNLRSGPGTEFDSSDFLRVGERFAVNGQSQVGGQRWWRLAISLWVRDDVVDEHGADCENIANVG
jgi:WD40 repeat protein